MPSRRSARAACLAAVLAACPLALPAPAAAHPLRFSVLSRASASGKVVAFDGSSVTIQTPGRPTGVVNALVGTAGSITRANLPYVWGGGHESAGSASVGIPGPGYDGRTRGFDCSGAVAAVLAGGELWPAGSGVPTDAGIISTLRSEGLIVPGVGTGPVQVTLYDHPGVHIFMNVNGRFFGTSDGYGANATQSRGGAGWLDDGAPDASSSAFKRYHFIASALSGSTSASRNLTFELGSVNGPINTFLRGDRVRVGYEESSTGSIFALSIQLLGATTTTGTVTQIAPSGTALTVLTPQGRTLALALGRAVRTAAGLQVGDVVSVIYTTSAGRKLIRAVTVTSTPTTPATGAPATGTPATGTPATGTPATGGPATGGPATGTPATGTPVTTAPLPGATGTPGSGSETINPAGSAPGYGPGSASGSGAAGGYDYGAGGYNGYARDAG